MRAAFISVCLHHMTHRQTCHMRSLQMGNAQHICCARDTKRNSCRDDDALAVTPQPFILGNPAGTINHLIWMMHHRTHHTMQPPNQGKTPRRFQTWRQRDNRLPWPLTRSTNGGCPRFGIGNNSGKIQRFGNLTGSQRNRIRRGTFRHGMLREP